MKETGDIWIGKIPSSWDIKKLKYLTKQSTVRAQSNDGYIALENVDSWNNRYIETGIKSEGDTLVANKGQVLFGKLRPYLAKVYLMPKDGCCSSEFLVLTPTDINAKYLLYGMTSAPFISRVDVSTYGTKMPRANAGFINNLLFPVPSPSEQSRIATFLDDRCGKIDEAIAKHKALIEKLNEYRKAVITKAVTKGVRGENLNWENKAIKHCFHIVPGATPSSGTPEYWGGDIVWVTPSDYKTDDHYVSIGAKTITREGYDSCSTRLVPPGSLIFSKRAPIGTVAISTKELCTNQGCLSCIPKKNVNVEFFYYAFIANLKRFDILGSGTTFKEISTSVFSNVKIATPSFEEQSEIVSFLDKKCASIDSAKERHQQLIAKLEEYKKSLIYNAVTGKINC